MNSLESNEMKSRYEIILSLSQVITRLLLARVAQKVSSSSHEEEKEENDHREK